MAEASEAWQAVKPTGLAAALLAITIVFTPMILVVIGLRIWVRVTHHCFGLEDWLMCIGATLNLVHNGVVIWGSRDLLADLLYQQLHVYQDIYLRSATARYR
ncbi:hypothetical protein LB505_010789 [Fusarium chuoi]|nr:hypothetical protein LB505_010789 [Fusarium chuoi]